MRVAWSTRMYGGVEPPAKRLDTSRLNGEQTNELMRLAGEAQRATKAGGQGAPAAGGYPPDQSYFITIDRDGHATELEERHRNRTPAFQQLWSWLESHSAASGK